MQPTPGKETPQDMEVRITGPPWRLPAYGNVYVWGRLSLVLQELLTPADL